MHIMHRFAGEGAQFMFDAVMWNSQSYEHCLRFMVSRIGIICIVDSCIVPEHTHNLQLARQFVIIGLLMIMAHASTPKHVQKNALTHTHKYVIIFMHFNSRYITYIRQCVCIFQPENRFIAIGSPFKRLWVYNIQNNNYNFFVQNNRKTQNKSPYILSACLTLI